MQRFKSIILPMQGKSKNGLHWLYNTKWNAALSSDEEEKIFTYNSLCFWFSGTSHRNSERLLLSVEIPFPAVSELSEGDLIAAESFLLSILAPTINTLSQSYANTDKNVREKSQFEVQPAREIMLRRNGIYCCRDKGSVILTIHFCVPLVNALSINAKAAVRAVRDILVHVESTMRLLRPEDLSGYLSCRRCQQLIRTYLKQNGLCAFVANGSILPRENGTSEPMRHAVPFLSPKQLEVTIPLENGETITGMGIRCGVTVITGGGYSGKSTLLDALEAGIYNHIPGDGREYVITDDSALKIYAEDGRPVHSLDLSPFFRYLPHGVEVSDFSTLNASGSVSQAANIIEALCGGCGLLLIDEDKSATNFMIRDQTMRRIVKNEPIIPFTDRVRELSSAENVSTILVIGGSGEYLSCADCVIRMDDYKAEDITGEISALHLPRNTPETAPARWTRSRRMTPRKTMQPFLFLRSVMTKNENKIILDEYSADITLLTAVQSANQINTLACVMEQLLTDKAADDSELSRKAGEAIEKLFGSGQFQTTSLLPDTLWRWYEEIRPLDVFCCASRMRGLSFRREKEN